MTMPARIKDVEAHFLEAARRRLESEGIAFDTWTIDQDGSDPIRLTAESRGQTAREFIGTPEMLLYERDPYTGAWECLGELGDDL